MVQETHVWSQGEQGGLSTMSDPTLWVSGEDRKQMTPPSTRSGWMGTQLHFELSPLCGASCRDAENPVSKRVCIDGQLLSIPIVP